jgi:HAD superfamily hydrolase (TIGR01490 family)
MRCVGDPNFCMEKTSVRTKAGKNRAIPAAIVDLDGTLFNGYIWQSLTRHHLQKRFKIPTLLIYLIPHLLLLPLFRLGLISADYFYRTWGENMAWLLGGVSVERGEAIWRWLVEEEICPNLRPEVISAVQWHQEAGHHVILLSGTFQPLLETLVEKLDLDGAIGTPLAMRGDAYQGRITKPLNIGDGKMSRIKAYSASQVNPLALQESFFYTDSIVDLPVMEMVGNPVAVYPDAELAGLAASRGWEILGEQKKTP